MGVTAMSEIQVGSNDGMTDGRLCSALRELDVKGRLPERLQMVHTTTWKSIEHICQDGGLKPKFCPGQEKNLVFLYYGGAFYRHSNPRQKAIVQELPVAFMLLASASREIKYYFPYDTGAASAEIYGAIWSAELQNWEKYRMNGADESCKPEKLVHCLFGDNYKYLNSEVNGCGGLPSPLAKLVEFYNADLDPGMDFRLSLPDKRRCVIECQCEDILSLKGERIDWLAIPMALADQVHDHIYDLTAPHMPNWYPYEYNTHQPVNEYHALIDDKAREYLRNKMLAQRSRHE